MIQFEELKLELLSYSDKLKDLREALGLPPPPAEQMSLFIDNEKRERRERLENTIEELRGRFGKRSVTYAALLGDLKMPGDGREKVRMPGLMYQ